MNNLTFNFSRNFSYLPVEILFADSTNFTKVTNETENFPRSTSKMTKIKDLKEKMQTNIEGVCVSAQRFGANNNLTCTIRDDAGKTFLPEITGGLGKEYKEIYNEKKRLYFIGAQIKIQCWASNERIENVTEGTHMRFVNVRFAYWDKCLQGNTVTLSMVQVVGEKSVSPEE